MRYCLCCSLLSILGITGGCYPIAATKVGPAIEQVQILATELYESRESDQGPPLPEYADQVRLFGADKYVGWLTVYHISNSNTKNLHKHLYSIGWFGQLWHLDYLVQWMGHEDARVQYEALMAFNRLSLQHFDSVSDAIAWWEDHQGEYPRFTIDDASNRGG